MRLSECSRSVRVLSGFSRQIKCARTAHHTAAPALNQRTKGHEAFARSR